MSNCKNCDKPIEVTQGRRPREFCDNNQKCRNEYYRKNKKAITHKTIPIEKWKGMVELPKDFIDSKKVGILKEDGTIEELNNISQLPKHIQMAFKGIDSLKSSISFQQPTPTSFDGEKVDHKNIDEFGQWEEPKNTVNTIPKTYQELKDMCPKELTGLDRSIWLNEEKLKHNL